MKCDGSGPAFPLPDSEQVRREIDAGMDAYLTWEKGMSRREYFAAAALSACDVTTLDDMGLGFWHSPQEIAKRCFAIADAMIKAAEDE